MGADWQKKVNKSAFLRRVKIKNIILPAPSMQEREEWIMLAGQVRTQEYLSICYAS
jgi:hypothetical protein